MRQRALHAELDSADLATRCFVPGRCPGRHEEIAPRPGSAGTSHARAIFHLCARGAPARASAAGLQASGRTLAARALHVARILVPALVLGVGLAVLPAVRAEQNVTVIANVDAREIPLGETLSYKVEVQGAVMGGVDPLPPSGLVNLQVIGGPSTSTSFSFVNGAVSGSRSYTWYLAPQAAGKARIGAGEVKVGGKIYRTEPIEVSVTQAGSGARPAPQQRGGQPPRMPGTGSAREPDPSELRLENEVSAERVYVGQPLILTTRLLTRVQVVDVSAGPDPTLPGFLLEESETNLGGERVFREGKEYQSYVLMRRILTPTSAGKTVVPPETRTIRLRVSNRDAFDFFTPRVMEVTRSTSPIALEALAPPMTGRPPDFSGAVGSFKMVVTADRKEASVGDAVGVKVVLSGSGNLKTVESPALAPSANFRVFDPRVEDKTSGIKPRSYTKTWSYVLTPLSPGEITLPAISFSYFDPEAAAYRKLSSSPERLAVKRAEPGGPAPSAQAASARREVQTLQRDIRFLKPLDGPLRRREVPLGSRPWLWAVLALPVLLQPAAWYASRRGGLSAFVPGGRRGRARRRALAAIGRAERNGSDPAHASSAAAGAILGFLADRCGWQAGGLTYEAIGEDLERRGVGAVLREDLRELLDLCDMGRFAPQADRPDRSGDLLSQAGALIQRLDREIGKAS